MPRLVWSPRALADIARLHAFLKSNSPSAANRAVRAIRQGVRLLATHPEAGRPADEMAPGFREWPITFGAGGYLAPYRQQGDTVVILAVRHGRERGY
ncbi:MAG TPA: type II toxin-antitoxin system RelE/ParE family toxin [Caulobacteraceae bacterium]|nr:type II toxin-antitoxin system RelE/ParE family toxin [Caulobacteraceae bacterium]